MSNKIIIIMGVSGSGKTTIGQLLSKQTGWPFYDADDFHSRENVAKMHSGIPLTDNDRWPWLQHMNEFAKETLENNSMILACSALKDVYRKKLSDNIADKCSWVYLKGSYELIAERLQQRQEHYMPSSLLRSQFDALEEPAGVIVEDIDQSSEAIAENIMKKIS